MKSKSFDQVCRSPAGSWRAAGCAGVGHCVLVMVVMDGGCEEAFGALASM